MGDDTDRMTSDLMHDCWLLECAPCGLLSWDEASEIHVLTIINPLGTQTTHFDTRDYPVSCV
jgi:hypothetical protein